MPVFTVSDTTSHQSGFSRKRANVDGDDDVNTADVVAVYNIIILGDTE